MAIKIIAPSSSAISDSLSTVTLVTSGKSAGTQIRGHVLIHGTIVGAASSSTSTVEVPINKNDLYSALDGKSLTNACKFRVTEVDNETPVNSYTTGTGNVTITARLSSLSWSTMANPYNLDSPTNMVATWTRPHSAFRCRFKVYVNNILCINRSGLTNSANFAPTAGELTSMNSAMGGKSPGSLKFDLVCQFNASSLIELTGGSPSSTRSNGIVKTFAEKSNLTAFLNFTIGNTISYTISQVTTGTTHDVVLKIGSKTILTKTNVGTGAKTITPSSPEIDEMYSATSSDNSKTATLTLTTKYNGTTLGTDSKTATATVGGDILPSFSTVTHQETASNPTGAYVQNVSNLLLTLTNAVGGQGAVITSRKITLDGKTVINDSVLDPQTNLSGNTGIVRINGAVTIEGTVTDSRNRTASKTVNISILPYTSPQVTGIDFYRCALSGDKDPMGMSVRFKVSCEVCSLKVDSIEQNSLTIRLRTQETGTGSWTLKQTISPSSLDFDDYSNVLIGYFLANSYDGKIEIQDIFQTTEVVKEVSAGFVLAYGKKSVGINKIPETGRALDINGDLYANGTLISNSITTDSLEVEGNLTVKEDFIITGNIIREDNDRLNFYTNSTAKNSWSWLEFWGDHESRAGNAMIGCQKFTIRLGSTDSFSGTSKLVLDDTALELFTASLKVPNQIYNPGMTAKTATANVHIDTSNGRLYRATSSLKYKQDITTYTNKDILKARPVRYRGIPDLEIDPNAPFYLGFIAEELAELKLNELVVFNPDGSPEAVNYDRISAALLVVIKDQEERLLKQEEKIKRLEKEVLNK